MRFGGKPKGFKFKSTLEKIEARELVRKMVTANLGAILSSQIANAIGVKYLVARDPATGTFRRIGPDDLNNPGAVEVWEKDPNVTAAMGLLAYAIDRPKEQTQTVEVTGQVDIVHILRERSARRLIAVGELRPDDAQQDGPAVLDAHAERVKELDAAIAREHS